MNKSVGFDVTKDGIWKPNTWTDCGDDADNVEDDMSLELLVILDGIKASMTWLFSS